VGAVVAVGFGVLSIAVLAGQVEVTDANVGVTRVCGSALDGLVDRSGWESWWAADLAETDEAVSAALVRTRRCPDAVNTRIAVAAVLGALAVVAALAVFVRSGRDREAGRTTERGRSRLARLGRLTALTGVILTGAGVVAVLLLVADADSTLFLYADRFVVAIAGLLLLVPTIVLVVLGRAITIASEASDDPGGSSSTDAARSGRDRGETDAG